MGNLHSQWLRIAEQLRDATTELNVAVSAAVGKVASGGDPKLLQLQAVRLARQRVNALNLEMDTFLDKHVP